MIAAELRLGNWVNTIVSDKPSIVTFIKSQKVKDGYYQSIELDEQEIYIPQHICGIPLTADILERAGFDEWAEGNYRTRPSLNKGGWSKEFNYYLPYYNLSTYTGNVPLKYLHQLQNLYWCLCGEELTINMLSESVKKEYDNRNY